MMTIEGYTCASRFRRLSTRGPGWLLAGCVVLLAAGAVSGFAPDKTPPVILALPAEPESLYFTVRAQVLDRSGVEQVTLYVRGPAESDYRALAMRSAGGDLYEAKVPTPPGAQPWIVYYVEARDTQGNGPGRNGSPEQPFYARFEPYEAREFGGPALFGFAVGLAAIVGLLLELLVFRPDRKRRERESWIDLLAPLSDKRGTSLETALDDLCSGFGTDQARTGIRVERDLALKWLAVLRTTDSERLREARHEQERRAQLARAALTGNRRSLEGMSREQVQDELFWYRLLTPLTKLSGGALDRALRDLTGRAHMHPHQGRRYFDVATLRRQLEGVYALDPEELARHGDGTEEPSVVAARSTRVGSPGMSLVELLVTLALIGIVAVAGFLYLKPIEAPVLRAGESLDGLFKQARSRAMTGMTVHRIRPLDERRVVVESASSCSSGAWTLDPRMRLELPQGVTVAETGWSVCFNGRGIATDNVVLTLDHPAFDARRIEVLKGGAVRWLP